MPNSPAQTGSKTAKQLAAIDQLLVAGVTQGPAKTKDAIKKILQLVPRWTRRDCCQRIRQLRKTSELAGLAGQPKRGKSLGQMGTVRRALCLRWTPAHDEKLVKLAGYEPVKKIALGSDGRSLRSDCQGSISRADLPRCGGGPPA